MKICILGSTGMAGHVIKLFFEEKGHEIITPNREELNITNDSEVNSFLTNTQPDVVINCIGILNSVAEENITEAIAINTYFPHLLEKLTRHTQTKIIHLSTDCVFSGKRGNYSEEDRPDALSYYGRSKALGEIVNDKDLTFRMSIVGPDVNETGIGLFNWTSKQTAIHGFSNVNWTGITTIELAKAIERAIEENLTGLFHLVPDHSISKYELIKLFNEICFDSKINIFKNEDLVSNKTLISTRNDFKYKVLDYREMVIEMKQWIDNHKEIYKY